jgi:hypothetical protein
MLIRQMTRIAVLTVGLALATAPAFAGGSMGGGSCWGTSCGGGGSPPPSSVPEPSTLALLGIAIPGAAAWIKRKLA